MVLCAETFSTAIVRLKMIIWQLICKQSSLKENHSARIRLWELVKLKNMSGQFAVNFLLKMASLKRNQELIDSGCPAAALGDPLISLMELVKSFAKEGISLEEGQVVLTGGLTNSYPLKTSDFIEATCPFETITLKVK